jgi:hypothetical protein
LCSFCSSVVACSFLALSLSALLSIYSTCTCFFLLSLSALLSIYSTCTCLFSRSPSQLSCPSTLPVPVCTPYLAAAAAVSLLYLPGPSLSKYLMPVELGEASCLGPQAQKANYDVASMQRSDQSEHSEQRNTASTEIQRAQKYSEHRNTASTEIQRAQKYSEHRNTASTSSTASGKWNPTSSKAGDHEMHRSSIQLLYLDVEAAATPSSLQSYSKKRFTQNSFSTHSKGINDSGWMVGGYEGMRV